MGAEWVHKGCRIGAQSSSFPLLDFEQAEGLLMVSFSLSLAVTHDAALCISLRGSGMPLFGGFANESRTTQGVYRVAFGRIALTAGTIPRSDSALAKAGQNLPPNPGAIKGTLVDLAR
jgi:hypothetical protein